VVARMATVTSMLANSFDHYFWTGFYVVDPLGSGPIEMIPKAGLV